MIVGIIRQKLVLTYASVIFDIRASVNSVKKSFSWMRAESVITLLYQLVFGFVTAVLVQVCVIMCHRPSLNKPQFQCFDKILLLLRW